MRDILNELNYMSDVIKQLDRLKTRPVDPNYSYITRWERCYTGETVFTDTSKVWLFANEYYCMLKERSSNEEKPQEGKV